MRKNADNLKISHRQLLSLALQGVPFALMNVFHKKKPTINISINCIDTSSFQLLRLSHLSLSPRQNPLRLTAITENFLPQRFSIFHQKSTQRSGYDPYFRCFLFCDSCWSLGRLTKSLPEPELYVRFSSLRIWFPWKNSSERLFPLYLYEKQPKLSCCIRWIVLFSATYLTKTLNI